MGIDPLAHGVPSAAHVSLHEAAHIARNRGAPAFEQTVLESRPPERSTARPEAPQAAPEARAAEPHTPVVSSGPADADRWDGLLQRLGQKHNVPWLFFKAVMLSESGGRPDAVGDSGHSVGLFQLHDQGYGHGMGDSRFDPETNAETGTAGLAASWHKVTRTGLTGEELVRATYDDTFNPGGGWAYQGDAVVRHYNALLGAEGLPPLR